DLSGGDRCAAARAARAGRALQGHRLYRRHRSRARDGARVRRPHRHCRRSQGSLHARAPRPHPRMTRLLIVRMSALGDIVHALPVLSVLREAWPSAEIDWLADERYAGVLDLIEGITNRVVVRPGYLKALSFMRNRGYDAALDLQGLIKSASA